MAALTVTQVPVDRIDPNPRNPRHSLARIDELADSIQAYGLLQPIVLRPRAGERFEIVAGHRRFAAVKALGWSEVPATIRAGEADDAYLLTLIENLQRADLSAREESSALEVLVRERGWSTRQVAEAVKRSASYVSRRLRVFEDAVLAPLVLNGQLSVSAAEELLPLPDARKRALAREAAEAGWDRPQVRAAVRGKVLRRVPATRSASRLQLARNLRGALRSVRPADLTEAERRELRLLFRDLALLAKAPTEPRAVVIPPLPSAQGGDRARRR